MAETKCKGEHSGHICVLASNQKFAEIEEIPNCCPTGTSGRFCEQNPLQ